MDPKKSFHDVIPPTQTPSNDLNNLYKDLPLPPSMPEPQTTTTPITPITNQIPDRPLAKTPIETPRPAVKRGIPWLRDLIGLSVFVVVIIVGAFLINTFVFRSFNVVGPSMEPTLEGGPQGSLNQPSDRLIVNRLPITLANITGKSYVPSRGQIIVFKNPKWQTTNEDEYVVKRVVGLPGERVAVNDCVLKVYNSERPNGFNPYPDFKNLAKNDNEVNTCVDGNGTDVEVPKDKIFVVGDHRVGNYSMDSRNGGGRATLGTIPLKDIIGPVSLRIWPLDQLKAF